MEPGAIGTVEPVQLEQQIRTAYLDYAMSVIVSRALPDVRDGLKPVHRRILYAMQELGLRSNTSYKKSARIVGEVLGKYHPHGDTAVYDAMVRMAQDFSMRYPLVDGQGNFGSLDNDPPAAMRYTEARLTKIAEEMLVDIDKETVDFAPNFDGSLLEPLVLPSRIPNLLLNGATGIAVGMATNIPPHNLGEVCDAIAYIIDNPEATVEDLIKLVPGPDFPTGGVLVGREGIKSTYSTGHGRMIVRAKSHIEDMAKGTRQQIVVTELPYQTNKATLMERISELARDKKIEGIAEIRDESDRDGIRIVIELRREGQTNHILNSLYKYTSLQSSFFANMLTLVDNQPRVITLKAALTHYVNFRRQIVTRRSQFDLRKAQDRAHILEGLKIALDRLDEVIATIRKSQTAEIARTNLMQEFGLSQVQAQAILDMQLRRLAALERKKIEDEYAEILKTIAYLEDLLANPKKIDFVVKEEVASLKEEFGDKRRTRITDEEPTDFNVEDLIPEQMVAVTLSRRGYIKRLPLDSYQLQRRGGKGIIGMVTRETDAIQQLLVANTLHSLLFFTDRGRVFHLKCHELPRESSRTAKGMPLVNLISIDTNEQVTAVVTVATFEQEAFLIMGTRKGEVKKTSLSDFASVRSNGLIAMDLEKGDELISACLARGNDQVVMASERGKAIKFSVSALRLASRTSGGVRGIRLPDDDRVVGMGIVSPGSYLIPPEAFLLVLGENGYGKRTSLSKYPLHNRGGGGVLTFAVTKKTGKLVGAHVVYPGQELMIMTVNGIIIRTSVDDIRPIGRSAQGVRIIRLEEGDKVASLACPEKESLPAPPVA